MMDEMYFYGYEKDTYYCYPNSNTLRNKLNIIDAEELKQVEREITALRTAQIMVEGIDGKFDFGHLKAIHYFLFQDIYEWAGEIRNVNISKGNQFCLFQYIEAEMDRIFFQLKEENYLSECGNVIEMGERLAYYLGEMNAIHPFREGNGRVQRLFLEKLAEKNGYRLDFMKISSAQMLEASQKSFFREYSMMEQLMIHALSVA